MSNLGTITYQVEVETAALVTGTDKADKQLDKLGTTLKKTEDSAIDAGKAVGKTGAALSTTGATAVDAAKKIDGAGTALHVVEDAAIDAGKAVTKVGADLKQTTTHIDKATKSSSSFDFALSPLSKSISGLISVAALVSLQKLSEQFTLLESRVKRLSASAADAKTNYAALVQISSAGGSDLTTTIKLWESLTASLINLGVTKDQVLSLTDTLQKIGKIGGSSAEEISAALRQFSQSVAGGTLRAEEFNSIIEQMPELGRKIADGLGIPFGELRQQMLDGKLTIDRVLIAIQEQTAKVNAEFKNVPRSVGDASNAIVNAMGVAISKIDQATGASQGLARALDAVAKGIRLSSGDLDNQQKLAVAMQKRVDIQTKLADPLTGSATRKAAEKELSILNDQIKAIQDRKVAEQKAENDKLKINAPAVTAKTDSQKALDDLQKEAELTRLVGVERAKLAATNKLGPGAKPEEIAAAQKLAVEIYNLENARKTEGATAKKENTEKEQSAKRAAAEEQRGIEQNIEAYTKLGAELAAVGQNARDVEMQRAELSLNEFATPEQIQQVREMAGALYDLNQAKANKALLGQMDPAAGAQQAFEQEMKNLETLRAAKGEAHLDEQTYLLLKQQSEQAYNDKMLEIEKERFSEQSSANAAMVAGYDALVASGTQALGGLLSGTMSLNDALGQVANTILTSVIGAIVEAGAKQVATMLFTSGVSTAQAAITTAAWTPAAIASSIASFGAAAVAGLAAMPSLLSGVSGKALGGPVQAGGMYRVNETGAPEIFNAANGRQYMMPNSRGDVVSNKDATSGGGGAGAAPIVNVNNYGNDSAKASAKFSEADRRWVIDVIVGDGMGDGKTGRMINQLSGTRRQGT